MFLFVFCSWERPSVPLLQPYFFTVLPNCGRALIKASHFSGNTKFFGPSKAHSFLGTPSSRGVYGEQATVPTSRVAGCEAPVREIPQALCGVSVPAMMVESLVVCSYCGSKYADGS